MMIFTSVYGVVDGIFVSNFVGKTSFAAVISFLRTLVFQVAAVLVLPLFWKLDGVWLSIVAAESLALGVTVLCFGKFKGNYQY